jgi:hypothetical protein
MRQNDTRRNAMKHSDSMTINKVSHSFLLNVVLLNAIAAKNKLYMLLHAYSNTFFSK